MKENNSTNVVMGILAYIGLLIIIPLLVSKNDPFVKYHIKQGLVLLVIEVILWCLQGFFLWGFQTLFVLINLGVTVLAIIGAANVINHKEKPLPLVGSFADNFNI